VQPGVTLPSNLVIPEQLSGRTVTQIGDYAFANQTGLTSITIPSAVTSIGYESFRGCINLSSVAFAPNSQLASIGDYAFADCTKLGTAGTVVIPNSVMNIGELAFVGCTSLTSISLPDNLTMIKIGLFWNSGLRDITIPSGVTAIRSLAFECYYLESAVIPDSVTTIERNAFTWSPFLTIYAQAASKPSGWDSSWNRLDRPVLWGWTETGPGSRVSFNSQGGSAVNTKDIAYGAGSNLPEPTRTGYIFDGWYTQANGAGTSYSQFEYWPDSASVELTLHAKWALNTYEITFSASGGTIGTRTVYQERGVGWFSDVNLINPITQITKPTRTGYKFDGYWTASGSSGVMIVDSDGVFTSGSESINVPSTMSARWIANTYTVAYNSNKPSNASGAITGSTANSSHTYDTARNLTTNGFGLAGWSFAGWNTQANGSGAPYTNSQSVSNLSSVQSATVTLYAQWTIITYSITYLNLNGATSSNPNTYTIVDTPISFVSPGVRTGYTFSGWRVDSANGHGITGLALGATDNRTLYAVWTPSIYTITLNNKQADLITGTAVVSLRYETEWLINGSPSSSTTMPRKTGYTFGGYWTGEGGTGTQIIANNGNFITTQPALTAYEDAGEAYAHWVNGSQGLQYLFTNNGTAYSVSRGAASDAVIIVPAKWNNSLYFLLVAEEEF